jgi:hypothetical protein
MSEPRVDDIAEHNRSVQVEYKRTLDRYATGQHHWDTLVRFYIRTYIQNLAY